MKRKINQNTIFLGVSTLIHVLGQIAYKNGCLKTVVEDLKTWENKKLVKEKQSMNQRMSSLR